MKKDVGAPTAAILILNTIANTAGATVAGMLADRVFGTSYILAFSAAFTLAILLFSEIVPKTYGAIHWRSLWHYVAWPLAATQKGMMPLVWLTQKFSSLLVANRPATLTTTDEVLAMIQLGARSGQLTSVAHELLSAVFHFDEIVCRQVMVPRNDVVFLEKSWPLPHSLDVARKAQHTRYPLCDGSFDAPVGIVHIKDLLGVDSTVSIDSVARPVRNVPETMPISHLLREMQRTQQHMALVTDKHGSIVGIVTLENLIEEIVGSVQDEHDDEQSEIVPGESGTYVVLGTAMVLRVNHQLAVNLPHSRGADTLSGLLVRELGRFLKVGDKVDLQGVGAEVMEVVGNRATKIRLTVPEPLDEEDGS
jgi:CBS domain containing-hemolysin-like protein